MGPSRTPELAVSLSWLPLRHNICRRKHVPQMNETSTVCTYCLQPWNKNISVLYFWPLFWQNVRGKARFDIQSGVSNVQWVSKGVCLTLTKIQTDKCPLPFSPIHSPHLGNFPAGNDLTHAIEAQDGAYACVQRSHAVYDRIGLLNFLYCSRISLFSLRKRNLHRNACILYVL